MRHASEDNDTLRSTVGATAGLTADDNPGQTVFKVAAELSFRGGGRYIRKLSMREAALTAP
jgi:hypothetical protein